VPEHQPDSEASDSESPPFLGTWRNIYVVVLLHLAVWILLLYLFTTWYRPDSA
jgi:hypothetical protein